MTQDTHEHAAGGCSCGCGTAGACSSKTWLISTVVIILAVLAVLWFVREPETTSDTATTTPAAVQPAPSR